MRMLELLHRAKSVRTVDPSEFERRPSRWARPRCDEHGVGQRTDRAGYSLVEMMAVLFILSFAMVSAVQLMNQDNSHAAMQEARKVMADIQMARMRMIAQDKITLVTISKTTGIWTLTWMDVAGATWNPTSGNGVNYHLERSELERRASFAYATPSSGTFRFAFNNRGLVVTPQPDTDTDPNDFLTITTSISFDITTDGVKATVTMNPAGQITVTRTVLS